MDYYNEAGEKVEAMSKEEAEQMATAKVNEVVKEKETEFATIKTQLSRMENKEYNWKKLREMTEEEKGKLTVMETELLKRQEALEEGQRSLSEKTIKSHEDEALREFAGDDEETRKKVKESYNRLTDKAETHDEIMKKMKDAATLAGRSIRGGFSGMGSIVSTTPSFPQAQKTKLSDEQKKLGASLGINNDDLKKYGIE